MAVYDALKAYVGAPDSDNTFVSACWDEAHALVDKFCGTVVVPAVVLNRAKVECGSELYHRRSAPNGIAQFATLDGGSSVRVARDPLVGVYPLLQPYVGLGIR
jgi:hypothetical protein